MGTNERGITVPNLAELLGVSSKRIRRVIEAYDVKVEEVSTTCWLIPLKSAKQIAQAFMNETAEAAGTYDACEDFINGGWRNES